MPDPYTHYRPTGDTDHSPGVYRVVGTGDPVALLEVADAEGTRVHTGTLLRVDAETLATGFEPAADPDAGLSPLSALRNAVQGLYWSVRRLVPG